LIALSQRGKRQGMRIPRPHLACALFHTFTLFCYESRADCCWPEIRRAKNEIAVGPSAAWARVEGRSDFAYGIDFTYFTQLKRAFPPYFWATAGVRAASTSGPIVVLPYAEMGTWFFLNMGFGYSAALRADTVTHYAHLFVGLPLFPRPIIEPYYRPAFRLAGAQAPTIHEVGLLLKWSTYRL
jgi:hypothetical protein